jgi:hypothetical protein
MHFILDIERKELPISTPRSPSKPPPFFFSNDNIPAQYSWQRSKESPPRQSWCELELDILAGDIINRSWITERPRKPLIDILNGTTSDKETKLVPSLASIWEVKMP